MADRIALLCSGQAGQHAGMFDLVRSDPLAAQLLHDWPLEEVCGSPLRKILSDEQLMFSNVVAQPLVIAAALATWQAIRDMVPRPALVAGYSVGELASWSVAGALPPEQTIRLAATRARLLQSCVMPDRPHSMLAISLAQAWMRLSDLEPLLQSHDFHTAIEVDADSIIAGGLLDQADGLEAAIIAAGGKVTRLPIHIASHTRWMRDAVMPFEKAVAESGMNNPMCAVMAGISGARLLDATAAPAALARQLAEPIRWHAVMDGISEAGTTIALELGPGSALSRMLKARHPHIHCRAIAEFKTLAGVKKWVTQHLEE
jgi:[acyl-carrier-protein] S-malonyltransferase